jgi:hypothetical protein
MYSGSGPCFLKKQGLFLSGISLLLPINNYIPGPLQKTPCRQVKIHPSIQGKNRETISTTAVRQSKVF